MPFWQGVLQAVLVPTVHRRRLTTVASHVGNAPITTASFRMSLAFPVPAAAGPGHPRAPSASVVIAPLARSTAFS